MEGLTVVSYSLLGTLVGAVLCLIPSLHIYNFAGIAIVIWLRVRTSIPYFAIGPFFMSMVVAFSFINTIPMTFFGAADESAGASMLPSNDMLMRGRGRDAALLSGVGTFLGALILIVLTPFYYHVWTYVNVILDRHLHWVLGLVVVFYVMSEWPKGAGRGKTPWAKFREAWRNVFAGLVTFVLATIVGLIVTTKPLAPPELSFQNIMPVFVGFFAIPSIIQTLISENKAPLQYKTGYLNADWADVGYGALPGTIGGLMCAYMPAVTVGVSAIFSGHMSNHRNLHQASFEKPRESGTVVDFHTPEMYYRQERVFLIGGGVNKILYYVGAFLLVFVLTAMTPAGMGRGGLNIMLKPVFSPEQGDYFVMAATVLFSAALSMLLLIAFTDLVIRFLPKINIRAMYVPILALIIGIVFVMGGGWIGLLVCAVTTCVGCIPVFYNCRRSHCMAVLLVPIILNFAGYGDAVARLLRLN